MGDSWFCLIIVNLRHVQWYQSNPHQFHLLTLGTIHSLPSPVTRRSQTITKPVFFDCLQREKNAWEGVRDARGWALGDGTSQVGYSILSR